MRCYARFLSSNCCKVHFHRLGLLRLSRRATSTPGPHLLYFVCVRFVLYLYHCACVLWLVSHIFKTRFFVLGIIIISLSLSLSQFKAICPSLARTPSRSIAHGRSRLGSKAFCSYIFLVLSCALSLLLPISSTSSSRDDTSITRT
jgi:hypothetical protein